MAAKKAKRESFLNQTFMVSGKQALVFALAFAVVGVIAVLQSYASPTDKSSGRTTGGGTIALSLPPVTDVNGDGLPNYKDSVRFTVSTTVTTQPWVHLVCSQNGAIVAQGTEGYFAGALDDGNFGLYSPNWASGGADCVAYLQQYSAKGKTTWVNLASTSFHVNP